MLQSTRSATTPTLPGSFPETADDHVVVQPVPAPPAAPSAATRRYRTTALHAARDAVSSVPEHAQDLAAIEGLSKTSSQLLTIAATLKALDRPYDEGLARHLLDLDRFQLSDAQEELDEADFSAPWRDMTEALASRALIEVPPDKHDHAIRGIAAGLGLDLDRSEQPDHSLPVLQRLPPEMQALFALADDRGFQMPAIAQPFFDAIAFPGFEFACQVIGRAIAQNAAARELERQVSQAREAEIPAHLKRNSLAIHRNAVIVSMASNILDFSMSVTLASRQPEARRFRTAAMELGAIFLHVWVLFESLDAEAVIARARKSRLASTEAEATSMEQVLHRYQALEAAEAKVEEVTQRATWLKGDTKPAIVASLLNLYALSRLLERKLLPEFVRSGLSAALQN